MAVKRIGPIHPGEILLEEFLKPLGISRNQLGRELKVSPRRINEIVLGKRGISVDTALRLARYFGTSPELWTDLQADFDLDAARDKLEAIIRKEVRARPGFAASAQSERAVGRA